MSLQHGSDNQKPQTTKPPEACGSIIDGKGREVPITEQMIQQACKALEESRAERVRKG